MFIAFLILFSIVPFLFYWDKNILDSNTFLSYNLSAIDFRTLPWHYLNGGSFGSFITPYVPIYYTFQFFNTHLGLPLWLIRFFFSVCSFVFCSVGMYFLVRLLFENEKISQKAAFLAGIFSIYNIYIVGSLDGSLYFILPYLVMPFQVYFFLQSLITKKTRFIILSALMFLFTFNLNFIFDVISYVVIFIFSVYLILQKRATLLRLFVSLTAMGILLLMMNLYSLLPVFKTTMDNKDTAVNILQSEVFYNYETSTLNIIRTFGDWGFFGGYDNQWYHSFSPFYRENILILLSTFLMPVILLIVLIVTKPNKLITWLLFVFISTVFIIMGRNVDNPLSQVFDWFFKNVPFFAVFKNTYKFTIISLFIYTIFLVYFLQLIEKLKIEQNKKNVVYLIIFACILLQGFPLLTGQVYEQGRFAPDLPRYWQQTSEYIKEKQNDTVGILVTPRQYTNVLNWNNQKVGLPSVLSQVIFPNPVFQPSYETYSINPDAQSTFKFIYDRLITYEDLPRVLGLLGIGHILQMNDADWKYYKTFSPQAIASAFSKMKGLSKEITFGKVELYTVDASLLRSYIYSADDVIIFDDKGPSINLGRAVATLKESSENDLTSFIFTNQTSDLQPYCKQVSLAQFSCDFANQEVSNWQKIDNTNYTLTLPKSDKPYFVVLSTTFDKNWALYKDNTEIATAHVMTDFYKNGWVIPPQIFSDTDNSEITLKVKYKVQTIYEAGLLVSSMTIFGCVSYLILSSGKMYISEKERRGDKKHEYNKKNHFP